MLWTPPEDGVEGKGPSPNKGQTSDPVFLMSNQGRKFTTRDKYQR